MFASVNWINAYLDPPASADEQAELLTRAGFPLEGRAEVDGGDVRQDFEMASNRGDVGCHVGMAREIAAISGRTLKAPRPSPHPTAGRADQFVTVINKAPKLCPLYTGRVIRGLRVGPSPKWLTDRLTAIGQIPRNNLVDISNFVLFELGQPTHVFDLAKLGGAQIVIRMAKPGESFLPIGEGAAKVKLTEQDLVIADEKRAVAIAGVKGGAETAVTETTTDILIEAASFDPVSVRNSSRRLNIASDSSYRFERGVHPGQVDFAAERLVELILELCGGELCEGVLAEGQPIPEPRTASMRPDRCRKLLGIEISNGFAFDGARLSEQDVAQVMAQGAHCTPQPSPQRPGLERLCSSGNLVFERAEGGVADDPITNGRTPGQRIESVGFFTGSSFRLPPEGRSLLTFGPSFVSLLPEVAWQFSDKTPREGIGGWSAGGVLRVERGRVAIFGEHGILAEPLAWAERHPELQNPQLFMNALHWLSGLLD
ncbi:MAG: hypothetical protein IIA64_00540 [Planctomycetes bacterium]|nr:hypothetical protein [Planctomycetota bacterium]